MLKLKFKELNYLVNPFDSAKIPEILVNRNEDDDGGFYHATMYLGPNRELIKASARSKERAVGFLLQIYGRMLVEESKHGS